MWVRDYMFTKVCTITPEITIKAAIEIMVQNKTNSVIVVDSENRPVGTFSSYTLVKTVVPAHLKDDPVFSQFGKHGTLAKHAEKMKDKKVEELMHTDFHSLKEDDAMIEAASYSIQAERRILPVVDQEGKLSGAITRTCIKNALYNALFQQHQIDPHNGGCDCCSDHQV